MKWIFGIIAVLLVGSGIWLLTQHQHQTATLTSAVTTADAAGQDTTLPVAALKAYVAAHMGTQASLTLTGAYNRAQAAAQAAAQAQAANSQIYAQAQAACAGKSDSITQAKCNQEYLAAHLVNLPNPAPVTAPKLADYQVQLRAPAWTPDSTGVLLAGGVVSLLAAGAMVWRGRRG